QVTPGPSPRPAANREGRSLSRATLSCYGTLLLRMVKPELEISPNTYYTPEEVATMLRVSRRNVLRLLEEGVARGVRIGRQWRILGRDLLDLPRLADEPTDE